MIALHCVSPRVGGSDSRLDYNSLPIEGKTL